jgi:uridine kinase
MEILNDIPSLAEKVADAFTRHNKEAAFTVAISGIDASGKGHTSKLLQEELESRGYKVANINIDPWQNPIPVRLQKENAAENFYKNVFRWDEVFEKLLLPLKNNRNIHLNTKLIKGDADVWYQHIYHFENIDFLLIDAILLFQEKYIPFYDFKIWIDCSFETGLQRALQRNVEKLDEERLIHDYNTYYYPAQRYHLKKDRPINFSDVIYCNDESLRIVGQTTINLLNSI